MPRWGMVIDLRKCVGCNACTIVCQETNAAPMGGWRRVNDCGVCGPPRRERLFVPLNCMHCEAPPCLEVCPTTATCRRPDGIVDIREELCVGCGACIVACPYQARMIMRGQARFATSSREEEMTGKAEQDGRGVCTKCSFCVSRLDAGLARGLKPGSDLEASPACVVSCSAGALYFGDFDDPESVVSRLIRENTTARLQEGLGTEPSIYYLVDGLPQIKFDE